MKKREFSAVMREICKEVVKDLHQEALRVFNALTEDERQAITDGGHTYFLPRYILLAIVERGYIDSQWGAESITPHVRRIVKILRHRPL